MSRARLLDVASRAGVSLATASRVLNGSSRQPGVELVERVRAAAAELGYVVNAQAQALARSRTGLLGLVVQDISDPYFSTIAAGAQSTARRHGLQLLLASTGREAAAEREAVESFAAHRAEAIVVVGTRWGGEDDRELERSLARYSADGGVAVVVGQPLGECLVVRPPNGEGARALASELLAGGHRRFVVVTGPPEVLTSSERAEAFAQTVRAGGGAVETVLAAEFSRDGGFAAAAPIAALVRDGGDAGAGARGEVPCVFAVTDVMAIGLIAGLRELGLRVPQDVRVAGFDDVPTLRDHVPALSTVRIPLEEMGKRAVLAAVGAEDEQPDEALGIQVVLRESTSCSVVDEV